MLKSNAILMFLILSFTFLIYSFSIYLTPLSVKEDIRFNKQKASDGRLVWQTYNCQSCHQLYGLGGYLGPDLTNIISKPNKGGKIIKAIVGSGARQMPAFNLSDQEMNNLIEFLKSVDASGTADPRSFRYDKTGMIEGNETK